MIVYLDTPNFSYNLKPWLGVGMPSKLLSGNEAVAQGAWEAGARIGVGYPGTPSTETLENLVKYPEVQAQWAPNEKVALEVALGASYGGARTLFTSKHVGINVAADPLFTMAYTGVNGGLVMLVADDPGMHSSQNEQDSRNYAAFAHIPMLEPSNPTEALAFTKLAFELSETYKSAVFVRTTVRVAHAKEMIELADRNSTELLPVNRNPKQWVMMPAMARSQRVVLDEKIAQLRQYAETFEHNIVHFAGTSIGVITSGVSYHYVREALPDASILKLGMVYPLPADKIKQFAQSVDRVIVIEEADDYLERSVRALGVDCETLPVPRRGELSPELIKSALGVADESIISDPACDLPLRPPLLCAGCPHRPVFYALNKMKALVTGDIGCYTLGAIAPLSAIDTCIDMGASIPMAHGIALAQNPDITRPIIAVIGDSTFAHSGITGLVNTIYNQGGGVVCILDNRITAMTGHQGNPVNGVTLGGQATTELDLVALCNALLVPRVRVVDPNKLDDVIAALDEESSAEELSVIIFRAPCALLSKQFPPAYVISESACRGCKKCIQIGCPAIVWDDTTKKASIIPDACRSCGLCAQVCTFEAISGSSEVE